ncbi:hypothetical protein BKA01_001794 [Pseudonocardia eucalypti]|nr:hypothetical protein [Pseudonocardia eucalypti]
MSIRYQVNRADRPSLVRRLHVDLMRVFAAACR